MKTLAGELRERFRISARIDTLTRRHTDRYTHVHEHMNTYYYYIKKQRIRAY